MSVIPERRRRKPEINIVPLIDVLTMLIFFLIITMQFRSQQSKQQVLNIVLPKVETAGQSKFDEQVEIGVGTKGEFWFNGSLVAEKQLEAAIVTAAGIRKDIPVLLLADENSLLKNVTIVMDLCRKHGLEKIRLQSR
ncbi:MAG: biopolymer transporter ExbD [Verrucomicrobiota bacterium]|nr:biopolymer transporter ExbD [Verrucomicrobiota bacterium]